MNDETKSIRCKIEPKKDRDPKPYLIRIEQQEKSTLSAGLTIFNPPDVEYTYFYVYINDSLPTTVTDRPIKDNMDDDDGNGELQIILFSVVGLVIVLGAGILIYVKIKVACKSTRNEASSKVQRKNVGMTLTINDMENEIVNQQGKRIYYNEHDYFYLYFTPLTLKNAYLNIINKIKFRYCGIYNYGRI